MKFVENLYSYEKLKWDLLETYESFTLEDVLDGEVLENRYGNFYLLEDNITIDREAYLKDEYPLRSELRLIKGIGEKRKDDLKERRLKNVNDLIEEGIYVEGAQDFLDEIDSGEYSSLFQRMERNLPKSHPAYLSLLDSIGLERILIFDIESLGFTDDPLFLIGTATFSEKRLYTKQFLARNKEEEKNIIREFEKSMEDKTALVSFNGRRFDENLIKRRAKKYELTISFSRIHIDFLNIARRCWEDKCENLELSTLETEILDIKREKDIPSILIPHFYQLYLEKDNPGTLLPIIEHNKRDLISISKLFKYV